MCTCVHAPSTQSREVSKSDTECEEKSSDPIFTKGKGEDDARDLASVCAQRAAVPLEPDLGRVVPSLPAAASGKRPAQHPPMTYYL